MNKIHEFSRSLWKVIQDRDVDAFKLMTHDNALFVHMGVTLDRNQEAETIKTGRITYQTIDFEEENIQQMDNIFVVLNKLKLTAIVGGNEVTNPFVVTEVYTVTEDSYKLASLSFTKIVY